MKTNEVVVSSIKNFQNEVAYGESSTFVIDEPESAGGDGRGPDPYTLLLAALGGCTSMTAMMYARRKGWALESVRVSLRQERVHAQDCQDCETDKDAYIHRIERKIELVGNLTAQQLARVRQIAMQCPVGKTLESEIRIVDEKEETQAAV